MLVLVLLMAIMLGSCSKISDYQSVIPAEPVMVVKANMDNLLTKSEVLQDNQITGFVKNTINQMPENSRELMRGILADHANCGLDLKQPAFVVLDNIEQARGFLLFAVKDANQVNTLINAIIENEEGAIIEDKGDYTVLKVNNTNTMAFDEAKLLVAFAQGACDATEYITAKENSQKSDALKRFIASKDDVAYYMAYKDILRLAEGTNPETFAMVDTEQFENAKLICNINFEAGKVVINGKFEDAEELIDKAKEYITEPKTSLQKFLPSTSYGFMQFGTENLGTNIEENVPEAQRETFNEYLTMANDKLQKMGVKTELTTSVLNSIDGGIIFGVSEADKNSPLPIPQMTLIAECKDDALFKLIIEALHSNKLVTKSEENAYNIMGMYILTYADNKIVVIPSNLYTQCYANGSFNALAENLSDNKISKLIGDKNGMVLDAQAIVGMIEEMGLARKRSDKAMLDLLRKFDYTTMTTNKDCEAEWVVAFEDANTNSLKQIKDMAVSSAIGNAIR